MENESSSAVVDLESKKVWGRFQVIFWSLFVVYFMAKGVVDSDPELSNGMIILMPLLMILMACNVGYSAYLFTGKKKHFLQHGVFGFFWLGGIGIFLSYFVVKEDYYNKIGLKLSGYDKTMKSILAAVVFLGIISVIGLVSTLIISS